jgi:hypothetical protein
MKRISLTALAFAMLFVLMSIVQAPAQTDEQFIAKLNGARYVHDYPFGIGTLDIQGNKVIQGLICTIQGQSGYCKDKPLGSWVATGTEWTLNGRGWSFQIRCPQLGADGFPALGLEMCKITEDAITCRSCGVQEIYTRER